MEKFVTIMIVASVGVLLVRYFLKSFKQEAEENGVCFGNCDGSCLCGKNDNQFKKENWEKKPV